MPLWFKCVGGLISSSTRLLKVKQIRVVSQFESKRKSKIMKKRKIRSRSRSKINAVDRPTRTLSRNLSLLHNLALALSPNRIWCSTHAKLRHYPDPLNLFSLRLCVSLKNHSPITVTMMVRSRAWISHSRCTICCQVPRISLPSAIGTVSDGPKSVACRCECPLPSCQACSWP